MTVYFQYFKETFPGFSKSIFALSNKLNVKTFIFQNKEESDYEK